MVTADTTLFRNNSLTIALFQVFSKIVGIRYIWATLGSLLNQLNEISKDSESGTKSRDTQMSLLGSELNLEVGVFSGVQSDVFSRSIRQSWKMRVHTH
jgi:hypothetical protein